MLFFLLVTRSLPIRHNVDTHFVSHAPFLTRLVYAFFSIQAARPKFYLAWTLGERRKPTGHLTVQRQDLNLAFHFFSRQRTRSTTPPATVSRGWMRAGSRPGISSETSTSWGSRCCPAWLLGLRLTRRNVPACLSLISNLFSPQTATSFKTFIDNWNIRTGNWLKTYVPPPWTEAVRSTSEHLRSTLLFFRCDSLCSGFATTEPPDTGWP